MGQLQAKSFRGRTKAEQNPKNLIEAGRRHLHQNLFPEAIDAFNRACKLVPSSFNAWMGLADAYLGFGKVEAANACYRRAIGLDGKNGEAAFNYASSLMVLGDFDGAIDFYQQAATLNPELGDASTAAIAEIHERKGEPEKAFKLLQPCLDHENPPPEIAGALAQLVIGHDSYSSYHSRATALLEAGLKSGKIKRHQRARFCFHLGDLYRKSQDYTTSFKYFCKAHELATQGDFDLSLYQQKITHLKKQFKSTGPLEALPEKFKNIFVVGLPRSGSSLVDRIISVNPEVASLGECNFFHHAVCEATDDEDLRWGCEPLDEPRIPRIKTLYRQKYLADKPPSHYFCDKSLENVFLVGQILQVFPEARIVWTKRDLRDLCLSCYTSNFYGRHGYVHDLKTLALYARMIEDLMIYWCRKYPYNLHVVVYEDLVTSQEETIRDLTNFLGFKWDESYLNSHREGYQVKTLSYLDVNRPIYTSAVGKWEAYRQFIEPLLEVLNGSQGCEIEP